MALKGNLRDFSIAQLLNLISLAGKTGTLKIQSDGESADLYFKLGKLVYATLGEGGCELAEALRQGGAITDRQARTIQSRVGDRTDRELGLLLINAGYLSQRVVVECMRAYILNSVYSLFTWSEGRFRFESGSPPVDGVISVPIGLENVIVQGSRRMEMWERLQEELPDLDTPLKFADRPQANLRDINLNVEEWRVISFIHPRNTIQQIARANDLSEFQIRKIIYGLLQAGLVELVRPEPAREPGGAEDAEPIPADRRRPDVKRNVILRLIDRIREL
ncbi:MAG: DUF4388 domain-containing protein [Anaerolineae bacterium]|jgi:hypothetical protein